MAGVAIHKALVCLCMYISYARNLDLGPTLGSNPESLEKGSLFNEIGSGYGLGVSNHERPLIWTPCPTESGLMWTPKPEASPEASKVLRKETEMSSTC